MKKSFWKPSALITSAFLALTATGFLMQNSLLSQVAKYEGKKITYIEFRGNRNVSGKTLLDIVENEAGLKRGDKLTINAVDRALKTIFNLGKFSYARVEGEFFEGGVKVIFYLQELPVVREIVLKGVEELNEQELLEALPLKEDDIYSDQKVAQAVQVILAKYREEGLFNAIVKVRKSEVDPEDNTLVVKFLIDEGEDIKISKINILGVKSVDPEDLYAVMELEEDGFIADGTFKEELFEKDKEAIIQYYREQGYLDAELTDARWDIRWKDKKEKDERVIVITYKVKEGDRYYFDGYDITWDEKYLNPTTHKPLFTKDQIYHFFEYTNSDIGDVFDYGRFQRDRGIINQLYSQRGYIFARVIPEKTTIVLTKENLDEMANSAIQKEYEAKGIDYYHIQELREILAKSPEKKGRKFIHTRFVIAEGDKGYIENIIIKGNKKTLDKVIRREILVKEGQLFNAALVQRSRERIYNLGFFKEVNVDARPGSAEGKMNLIIEVEEQPTGTISLGGGYGTQTGFSIFTEVSENNLNGTGQRISGRVEFGPQRQAVEASWTEPWLFDKPWSLTLSGFYSHRVLLAPALSVSSSQERATYAKDSFGTSIGIGHRFWINWGHYHRFSPVLSRASDPSSMVADSVYLLVSQGWQLKNTLTNGIYYDNRDNVFNTTQGFRWDTWVDVVGSVLGGDDHYNRYNMIFDYFWWPLDYTFFNLIRKNVLRRWRIVFEHRVSLAFSHETGPVYKTQDKTENAYMEPEDLLLLGGYESLRGWNLYDSLFPTQWQDGGKHRILFTTELRLPVEPNLFWLVLFFDAGALYENPNEFVLTDSTSAATKASISDSALTLKHINLSYFRYSWGFGFRLQIPILPLRLYLAKRLIWDPDRGWFKDHPVNSDFQFVFGIGDRRF